VGKTQRGRAVATDGCDFNAPNFEGIAVRILNLSPRGRLAPVVAGCVWTLSLLASAGAADAQERAAPTHRARSEVRDEAGMFGPQAVARVRKQIEQIERDYRIPILIETIEALRGQTIDDAATRRARQTAGEGIFILAARRDRRIEVLVSEAFTRLVPDEKRLAIRAAFIEGFKQGNYDEGLERGVQMIEKVLAADKLAGNAPESATSRPDASAPGRGREPGPGSSLVLRNQVRLTLAGARRIIAGAEAKATELGLKMNIAVVDDGGHLLAFERMDGARPASGYTATTKAVTAATFRAPSGPIPAGTSAPDPLLNLSLQNAALASGGKITTLYGGVPVMVDDQVIGGVGVGGGSGEQDASVARAGIDAFLADLKGPAEAPREAPPAEK
jgi:glc operon protein GlcG